jgi:hypothetical protein
MPITPDGIFRRLLLDPRSPVRLRLQALEAMSRPSLRLLYMLTKDRSPKIRFLAATRLATELARKELRKRAEQRNNTSQNN